MDGTILSQGSFLASYSGANPNPGSASRQAGDPVVLNIPSGVDWIRVKNISAQGANGTNAVYFQGVANAYDAFDWYWQRGMANGLALVEYKANGAATVDADLILTGGFTIYDPSGQDPLALPRVGNPVATTASTNATRPVVSTGNTAGVQVGSVVRLSNTAQTDVNGIDMVVSAVTANTSFTLLFASNALATAPGAIGGAGFYRLINFDLLFYPRNRYVTNISQAANAQVSVSVAHGLTPGQQVQFNIPAVSGMVQLNPSPSNNYLTATVLSIVDDYNFTINVNTTAFTAFTWPTIAQQPSSFPQVSPIGENTAASLSINAAQVPSVGGKQIFGTQVGLLADATTNVGFLGMILGSGGNGNALTTPIVGPAGTVHFSAADVIDSVDQLYWVAGKSSFGGL